MMVKILSYQDYMLITKHAVNDTIQHFLKWKNNRAVYMTILGSYCKLVVMGTLPGTLILCIKLASNLS